MPLIRVQQIVNGPDGTGPAGPRPETVWQGFAFSMSEESVY